MKKRMTALVTALLVTMLCLPFYLFTTGTVVNAFYYKNDDLGRFGPNEEYVIVPMNARNSALTFDTPAEGSKSTTFSLKTKDEYYTNQIWVVRKVGDYYAFECKGTGMVVGIPGGKAVENTALQVHEYNETDALYWRLEAMEDGSYIIHSKLNDNLCWDMKGASNADGTETMLHPRHANPNQRFRFVCVSTSEQPPQTEYDDLVRYGLDEEYSIVPLNAGNSAVDLSDSSGNGKAVHLWKTHRMTNQRWKLKKVGDYYAFISVSNGRAIDVPDGDAASGKGLVCHDYHGGDNQLFRLESMGDGTYMIHSKRNDSFVWNIRGASWNDGSALQLYSVTKDPNERFRFVHVSTVEPMSDWGSTRQDCNGSNWSVWDGTKNTGWYDSSTTDLYINSAADLGGLSLLVESGHDMLKKTIHLNCDINLAGIHWTPIGFADHWFRGSFNGHNHAIIGLNNTHEDDNAALFGRVNGGIICNLAVKGTIKGNYQVGGVVALLEAGHVVNVYSEINITNATDDREGGIAAAIAYGGMVDHCTQNATINSSDDDPFRGGIAGYSDGFIRYCVNNATVNLDWNYGGGIAGKLGGGTIEFCANHGTIGGGGGSQYMGGIAGYKDGGIILGCYNDGKVFSTNDDYVGGICGYANSDWLVICCINNGRVYGDDQIGGICGEGRPIKCLNMGVVTGHEEVGAISGNARADTPYCYALAWSSANLSGKAGDRASWVTADQIMSGEICYNMDFDGVTYNSYGITAPLSQNIGSDPYPTFGSAPVVKNGSDYSNGGYHVTVETDRGYGSVSGGGEYSAGNKVTLKAAPAPGCLFDHFEVKTAESTKYTGWNGSKYDYPNVKIQKYDTATITLTTDIKKSYTVRAVFKAFDETPPDMKVTVKLELECTDDVGGWNRDILPVDVVDSAGESHHWETNRQDVDDKGEKVSHTFDLGAASPVAVHVTPDFGGGFTFHSYGVKARLWVNDSGSAMESKEVVIRSWPFVSSTHNDDYMNISFENYGNSYVAGRFYTKCSDAWNRASGDADVTIRLESAWLVDGVLELPSGKTLNLDLNGYPIIRALKKTQDDGELFKIGAGAVLNIIDSTPSRKSCGNFTGGSIQGGRSDNTAGLIECLGTVNMTGGTLYNGGTTDKGGAIKLSGSGTANLTNVLISNCWSDKAVTYQNEGGAIYMKESAKANLKNCTIRFCRAFDFGGGIYLEDDNNRLTCENVNILTCTADDNQGGGVYQDHGETHWVGGNIKNCRAGEDNGGGFYQNNGKAYFKEVDFEGNYSEDNGGAFYSDTSDGLWFINCKMTGNRADDHGGALYMTHENLYMENCTVTSNSAGGVAGGLYIDDAITMAGVMVIRGNDGKDSMDNLVLCNGALLYNLGLEPGSEVHLRSKDDGNVKLGGSLMSTYQLEKYFRADYGSLSLTETKSVDTSLRASVFSVGTTALYIGAAVLLIALVVGIVYRRKKQKGGA